MTEKILIVDDDMDTLRLVGMLLQRKGYQIIAAGNGGAALEKARSDHPELILLDVMMPDMDGYEVLRRLRGNPNTKDIPVIMFTAKAQVDDKVTGFEAGADDYLTKPTHPAELLARVKSILARAKTERPAAPPPPTGDGKPPTPGVVVGVLSAKGGQGVSMVALNLAALFTKVVRSGVIVADLMPGEAGLSNYLGYHVQEGLVSLLRREPSDISARDVESSLITHNSGLRLLPASYIPSDGKYLAQVDQFPVIVKHLKLMSRFTVVDLGSHLLPGIEKAIEVCDQLIVVVEPLLENMSQTKALLGELSLRVLGLGQINLVLNSRHRMDNHLSLREVQDRLGHSVTVTISPASELVGPALQQGTPMVLMHPEHLVAQQFTKLAQIIFKAVQPARV